MREIFLRSLRGKIWFNGDPGVIRTPDLRLRRQSLYPLSYGAKVNHQNIATIPRFVKPSANHVHDFHEPAFTELYRLNRAHLMTAIAANALPVVEV